jgi:hypothetical protein
VLAGALVRRIHDRPVEERIRHRLWSSPSG